MLIKSYWVCINRSYVNKELLTEGKIYEFTKEVSICPVTNVDLSLISFIADDDRSYLIDLNNENDFIPLDEWRQRQLNKLL